MATIVISVIRQLTALESCGVHREDYWSCVTEKNTNHVSQRRLLVVFPDTTTNRVTQMITDCVT